MNDSLKIEFSKIFEESNTYHMALVMHIYLEGIWIKDSEEVNEKKSRKINNFNGLDWALVVFNQY